MIESLTGYGSAERGIFRVEAKSLNHRFLEINIKLPNILSKYDIELRNLVKQKFQRGKFDIIVSLKEREISGKIFLNKNLAKQLYSAFIDLKKELSILGSIDISMFANFKELFVYQEEEPDINALKEAVLEALENLHSMRKREGEIIKGAIMEILQKIEIDLAKIEGLVDISYNNFINNVKNRVKEIINSYNLEENRIFEQIIIFAQKIDIKEEVDRLKSHLIQFKEIIQVGGAVGKKLDFLLQEVLREINTILSKTESLQIKNLSIEI
ncbi:MAG: YicC/YloC family endoribonuclease, partial [Dictyoglomus sp.]